MRKNKPSSSLSLLALPLLFIHLILLTGCSGDDPEDTSIRAIATLTSIHAETDSTYIIGDQSYGTIEFSQATDSTLTVEIYLENFLPNTIHSVHIHSGSCEQPGMHWNQGLDMNTLFCNELSLGIPWAKPSAGDIGNVSVGYDGSGYFSIQTDLWRLGSGNSYDILNLSVVVHETYDDFTTQCDSNTHSHSGNAKMACGIITLAE